MLSKKKIIQILLINPNLGHPKIISKEKISKSESFSINLVFLSKLDDLCEFEKIITNNIELIPLLDLKSRRDQKKVFEKLRSFWKGFKLKIRNLFSGEKIVPKHFNKRAFRDIPIKTEILNIKKSNINLMNKIIDTNEEYYIPKKKFQKIRFFPSEEQESILWILSGKCRLLYNFALAERIENWQ